MDFRLQFKVQAAVARKSKQQEIGSYLQSGNREGGVHLAISFSFTIYIAQDASLGLMWPTKARSSYLSQCNQDDPHRHAQRPNSQVILDSVKSTPSLHKLSLFHSKM